MTISFAPNAHIVAADIAASGTKTRMSSSFDLKYRTSRLWAAARAVQDDVHRRTLNVLADLHHALHVLEVDEAAGPPLVNQSV